MFSINDIHVSRVRKLILPFLTLRFLIIFHSHLSISLLIFPNSTIKVWTCILTSAIWRHLSCKKTFFMSNFSFVLHIEFSFSNGKLDMHPLVGKKKSKNKRLIFAYYFSLRKEQLKRETVKNIFTVFPKFRETIIWWNATFVQEILIMFSMRIFLEKSSQFFIT